MSNYATLPGGATLDVKPFKAHVTDDKMQHFKKLLELSPIAAPSFESTSAGRRYGLTRAWCENAKDYWLNSFDWRKQEDRINSFPNFKATVKNDDGNTVEIQFLALLSKRADAVPIAFLHGWPSSIFDFVDILDALRGKYTADDLPYHVIVPSLPGYGYSSGFPIDVDCDLEMAASALHNLMVGLGFGSGYMAHGGDLGSFLSRILVTKYDACKGMHVSQMVIPPPAALQGMTMDDAEKQVIQKATEWLDTGSGSSLEQGTRTSTLGLVLSSSPLALLGWIGEKMLEWTDEDPPLEKILETVTLYWMTECISGCMYHSRVLFGDSSEKPHIARTRMMMGGAHHEVPYVKKPVGFSLFAQDIVPVPKRWAELTCNVVQFNAHKRGAHFAALEMPRELLADIEDYVSKARTPRRDD